MLSSSQKLPALLCFLLLVGCIFAFELTPSALRQKHASQANSIKQASSISFSQIPTADCAIPQLFQSIPNFTLSLNDVSLLLANQYSHNNISNVAAPNKVTLYSIVYSSHLLSSDQSQSYDGPLKAKVSNNQAEFTVDFKINITEGTLKRNHTFTAQTKINNIAISYEKVLVNLKKEFNLQTGGFVINTATVKINSTFMTTTYNPSPNKTETQSFDTAIKGTTQSLYAAIVKLLSQDQVKQSMQSNIKNSPISKIYTKNPYNYNFQNGKEINFTIPIDISTTWYKSFGKSLSNGMAGKMPNNNKYCNSFVPDFATTGGQLFFSKEFIQNFVQYNVVSFSGWQNIKVDKNTVRSNLLQWKLMDLDYVVDGLWSDLWNVYQNEIYFTCSAKENVASQLNPQGNKLHQTLKWICEGFVKLNETTHQKVMEFMPRINHIVDMSVYGNSLQTYANVLKFIDCQFNQVRSLNGQGVYKVKENNMKLIQKLMESVFNDFRVYTIGHRFWFGENSKTLRIDDELRGVWVF